MLLLHQSFYPCFNGIRVGTRHKLHNKKLPYQVSILVLMELGLELNYLILKISPVLCFYPCFNGIRVGTNISNIYYNFGSLVSILVLMELGLELVAPPELLSEFSGFYPCFNGIRVGTVILYSTYLCQL